MSAYYDPDDKEIGAYFLFFGSQVGSKYSAGLDSGINLGLNLVLVKASVGIFKSGNEIKVRYAVKEGLWGNEKSDEFRVLSI